MFIFPTPFNNLRAVMQVNIKLPPKSINISYSLFHEFPSGRMFLIKQDIQLTAKFYDDLFGIQIVTARLDLFIPQPIDSLSSS